MNEPTFTVLHVSECPNLTPMLDRLREATSLPVTIREVRTETEAAAWGMAGSPTLLIDGVDPFASSQGCECGLSCRLYRDENGRIVPVPTVDQLRAALTSAQSPKSRTDSSAAGALSAWRRRAIPLDPVETAVHQAILRRYGATGAPPHPDSLEALITEEGRTARQVLESLHEVDALRLSSNGEIALAYPFSTQPTRHRVTIGRDVKAYAMCAIDALGISAMLDQDVLIESHDVTSKAPITVSVLAGRAPGLSEWNPPEAVVFVGAEAGGGPSVDCCCDHLNFFTSADSATRWMTSHPMVTGQLLTPTDAEELGVQLFEPLLHRAS